MIFLGVDAVEALHAEIIEHYGGSHGLRDRGLLESAVARAENKAFYDANASVGDVAASLAWGLIKIMRSSMGNKRVGIVALVAFLELNGYQLICPEVEETAMVLRAAASEMSEDEWTAWVVRSVAPLG